MSKNKYSFNLGLLDYLLERNILFILSFVDSAYCIPTKENQCFLLVYIWGLSMSPHSRQRTYVDQQFDPKVQTCQHYPPSHSQSFVR